MRPLGMQTSDTRSSALFGANCRLVYLIIMNIDLLPLSAGQGAMSWKPQNSERKSRSVNWPPRERADHGLETVPVDPGEQLHQVGLRSTQLEMVDDVHHSRRHHDEAGAAITPIGIGSGASVSSGRRRNRSKVIPVRM